MQLGDRAADVYTTSVSVMSILSTVEDLVLEHGTGLCSTTSIKSARSNEEDAEDCGEKNTIDIL